MVSVSRKRKNNSDPLIILLVTNGAVTETKYLNNIRKMYGIRSKLRFQVVFKSGSPKSVLDEVKRGDQSLYDSVWIFFDKDDNTDDELNSVLSFCKRNDKINSIVSVPCFEIWLHAHYGIVPDCSHQLEAIERYSKAVGINKGDKDLPDSFPFEKWEEAVVNLDKTSKKIRAYAAGSYGNTNVNELGSSPSTSMGKFMNAISELHDQELS
jgi:hypothetical protein